MKRNKVIVIAGPTGVGKTGLSIKLAKKLNAEIVSCDSMQIYKYMDIGTAKIRQDDMLGIKHHMIDIINPNINFDIVEFQKMALKSIEDIHKKNKIAILVGGTGFYIQSIINEVEFTSKLDNNYRLSLEKIANTEDGKNILSKMLCEIDPESFEVIHSNNIKKIIRALEFYNENNYSIQQHNKIERKKKRRFDTLFYVLNDDRAKLYKRINERVDIMFENGLLDEVKSLINLGIKDSITASQAIGYKEVIEYLEGRLTLYECKDEIKKASRHYAKRQLTWFKKEKDVIFIDRSFNSDDDIIATIMDEVRNYV